MLDTPCSEVVWRVLATGSRGVLISGSNAGYTMVRGSVKSTGYPLHSPDSPSFPLQCLTVCHHISTGVCRRWSLCSLSVLSVKFWLRIGRSQWPRVLRLKSAAARLLRSWVWIPPGSRISDCCDCCVLSGWGLCEESITRPEESYRPWCVVVCNLEISRIWNSWPTGGKVGERCSCAKNKNIRFRMETIRKVFVTFEGTQICYLNYWRRNYFFNFSTTCI